MVPRGGLRKVNQLNDLAKSGTINLPIQSLCFLARVSHRQPSPVQRGRCSLDLRWGSASKASPEADILSTALGYSAAMGDATLGELAEWDPEFVEPFAPGALISASGLSERRDFPSK